MTLTLGNGSNTSYEIQQLIFCRWFTEILCRSIGSPSDWRNWKIRLEEIDSACEMIDLPLARNRSSCRMHTAFRQSIDASISVQSVNIFPILLLFYFSDAAILRWHLVGCLLIHLVTDWMSPHNVTGSSANRKVLQMNRFTADDQMSVKIGKYRIILFFIHRRMFWNYFSPATTAGHSRRWNLYSSLC